MKRYAPGGGVSAENAKGPDFLIVGQMKCATTSLYGSLCASPQFVPVAQKEVHFFTINAEYAKGTDYYEAFFPEKKPGQLTGEASPSYFNSLHAPGRISKHYPGVKLIVCLRSPGARAISHYYHEVRNGKEIESIEDAFRDTRHYFKNGYVFTSQYAPKLAWYLQFFDPRQMCVFVFESFLKNPKPVLHEVYSFLGLQEPEDIPVYSLSAASPKQQNPIHAEIAARVNEYCDEITESLVGMTQKFGFHMAGDIQDLVAASRGALPGSGKTREMVSRSHAAGGTPKRRTIPVRSSRRHRLKRF